MEIIERPNKVYKCNRCGSKLKITRPSDLHYGYLGYISGVFGMGKSIYGYYIQCPCCLNKVIVEYDD